MEDYKKSKHSKHSSSSIDLFRTPRTPNDEIFIKLSETIQTEKEQKAISDFLTLFYYFIVCYSKRCFRKNAQWYPSNYKISSSETQSFRYELANENKSHSKILNIQKRMYHYRQEYKNTIHSCKSILTLSDNTKMKKTKLAEQATQAEHPKDHPDTSRNTNYFTKHKQDEIMLFIFESLELLCTDIQEPVILLSFEIQNIISKYQDEIQKHKTPKKSKKLNYDVLATLGIV